MATTDSLGVIEIMMILAAGCSSDQAWTGFFVHPGSPTCSPGHALRAGREASMAAAESSAQAREWPVSAPDAKPRAQGRAMARIDANAFSSRHVMDEIDRNVQDREALVDEIVWNARAERSFHGENRRASGRGHKGSWKNRAHAMAAKSKVIDLPGDSEISR
jgi:hypothetical protein